MPSKVSEFRICDLIQHPGVTEASDEAQGVSDFPSGSSGTKKGLESQGSPQYPFQTSEEVALLMGGRVSSPVWGRAQRLPGKPEKVREAPCSTTDVPVSRAGMHLEEVRFPHLASTLFSSGLISTPSLLTSSGTLGGPRCSKENRGHPRYVQGAAAGRCTVQDKRPWGGA